MDPGLAITLFLLSIAAMLFLVGYLDFHGYPLSARNMGIAAGRFLSWPIRFLVYVGWGLWSDDYKE